jgi:hypothetical protein
MRGRLAGPIARRKMRVGLSRTARDRGEHDREMSLCRDLREAFKLFMATLSADVFDA